MKAKIIITRDDGTEDVIALDKVEIVKSKLIRGEVIQFNDMSSVNTDRISIEIIGSRE